MASAAEMLRRIKGLSQINTLREMVAEQLVKEEDNLIELKKQQFLEGDIYGSNVKDTYFSSTYASQKFLQNPLAGFGNVDLIKTGSFIESFQLLKPKEGKYLFGATDPKKGKLVKMYGLDIMGFNQQVFNKFQKDIIAPRFLKQLKKIINKR